MTPRRSVVLIAPYFPPRRRVGSLRPFRFAIHLRRTGWQPHVICFDTPSEELTGKERELLADIPVLRLRAALDGTIPSVPVVGPRKSAGSVGVATRVRRIIDAAFPVDTWYPVLMSQLWRAARFIDKASPSVLWSTADPWSTHLFARRLARRFGLPWVADFRDPWTLCEVRSRDRSAWTRAIDRRSEASVIAAADRVVFTAERTADVYRQAYQAHGEKIGTIRNSFDSAWLESGGTRAEGGRAGSTRPTLDLIFFGAFRELSPALPVIEMLVEARRRRPSIVDEVRVRSASPLTPSDAEAAAREGVAACFETFERVPYEDSLAAIGQADLALLSTDARRDQIIPAKLWDYLPAGRPVLSITRSSEVGGLIDDLEIGVQLPVAEAAERLVECVLRKRAGEELPIAHRPHEAKLAEYDAPATTARLAALFDEVTRKG